MRALLDACRFLPITTFEAVAALTRNPEAIAQVAIQRSTDAWLWDRLQQLPFLWACVPIRAWVVAASRYAEFLRHRYRNLFGRNSKFLSSSIRLSADLPTRHRFAAAAWNAWSRAWELLAFQCRGRVPS